MAPFFLSCPSANPHSLFAHYEICSCREEMQPGDDETHIVVIQTLDDMENDEMAVGDVFYTLYGRFDSAKHPDGFGGVEAIADRQDLQSVLDLLIAINGPFSVAGE